MHTVRHLGCASRVMDRPREEKLSLSVYDQRSAIISHSSYAAAVVGRDGAGDGGEEEETDERSRRGLRRHCHASSALLSSPGIRFRVPVAMGSPRKGRRRLTRIAICHCMGVFRSEGEGRRVRSCIPLPPLFSPGHSLSLSLRPSSRRGKAKDLSTHRDELDLLLTTSRLF
ncbi:hypothetical protein BHE74_00046246 [Ensete ventricosum]|nr:hypothetical protein BHE74_00046246 [Ensete ventricosum]